MLARNIGVDRIPGAELDLHRVSRTFDCNGTPLPALDRVNLQIRPGEFVAVLGPRGCGKTTLLRLVAGLVQPSSGTILIDGEAGTAPPHLVVSRQPAASAWCTVHAQVAAARDERRGTPNPTAHTDQILRLLGLHRFAGASPRDLSAGNTLRLALATALVNDPRLLLLDNPFTGLDPITRATIQGELIALWQRIGCTVLLTTSSLEEAVSVANRVVVLDGPPAGVRLDHKLDCESPRHPADPCVASVRRALSHSLDGLAARHAAASHAATSHAGASPAPRFIRRPARTALPAPINRRGGEPAAYQAAALA